MSSPMGSSPTQPVEWTSSCPSCTRSIATFAEWPPGDRWIPLGAYTRLPGSPISGRSGTMKSAK